MCYHRTVFITLSNVKKKKTKRFAVPSENRFVRSESVADRRGGRRIDLRRDRKARIIARRTVAGDAVMSR